MLTEVVNTQLKKVGELDLKDSLFMGKPNPTLCQELTNWQLAKRRKGNAKTKTRDEVSGSTRKIYRQKGTGRARHGSRKAPIFRGGGVTFGPQPRSYEFKLSRKLRRLALCAALSEKQANGQLKVLEDLKIETLKTKQALALLKRFSFNTAVIVDQDNALFSRAVRNLRGFKYLQPQGLNVYDLKRFEGLIITKKALETTQEVWS